jgi:hypothetical protein
MLPNKHMTQQLNAPRAVYHSRWDASIGALYLWCISFFALLGEK